MGQIKNIKLHIVTDIKLCKAFAKQQKQDGRRSCTNGVEEEEDLQEVHVPRFRPRPTARPLQRTTHGNRARPGKTSIHTWAENEAHGSDEETPQSEERSSPKRETCGGEDSSSKHDRPS